MEIAAYGAPNVFRQSGYGMRLFRNTALDGRDMMMKTMKRDARVLFAGLVAAIALFFGCVALTGCSSQEPADTPDAQSGSAGSDQAGSQNGPCTFTDDTGAEVTVDNPERVVACMGSFANTWELAGGTLVGASDDAFESYSITSADAVKVGDFSSPNLESIIALEPDFVIMTSGSGGRGGDSSQADLKQSLEASGIPVAYFEVTTFDDYLRMLRTFCDITGRDDLYEQNGQAIADAIDEIKASVPAGDEPTVLAMTTFSGGTRVQNSSTMTGAMLADLGVKNLADENQSLLKDFSLESVIELDPDFIFVVPMGNDDTAALKNLTEATEANPAWATLSAVKDGRFITLEKELFLYKPNEHWAESYQTLFDHLYA